ncbi:MAG: hypothetical protein AAF351_14850, partial [Pseudomonadota bacterium]
MKKLRNNLARSILTISASALIVACGGGGSGGSGSNPPPPPPPPPPPQSVVPDLTAGERFSGGAAGTSVF